MALKKRGLMLIFVLLILPACVGSFLIIPRFGLISALGKSGNQEFIISCSLPSVPKNVPYLKVVYSDVNPEEAKRLTKEIFGFNGNIKKIPPLNFLENGGVGGLFVENLKRKAWFFRSGAIAYSAGKDGPHYIPKHLPSYEEAKRIAEAFIEKVKTYNLVPSNLKIDFVEVGPAEISIIENKKIINSLSVTFKLSYENIKITGSGVHVTIGENGEILSFGGLWRKVEKRGYIPITVTPENALVMLKSQKTAYKRIEIKSIELAYLLEPVDVVQESLPPIYLFWCFPEGEEDGYCKIIPATENGLG